MNKVNVFDMKVRRIMENNILSDIVFESEKFDDRILELQEALERAGKNPWDFLLVVLKKNHTIKGIITFKELNKVKELKEEKSFENIRFDEICDKNPIIIKHEAKIKDVVEKLKPEDVFIVLVVNEKNEYVGKIRQTNLASSISDLQREIQT